MNRLTIIKTKEYNQLTHHLGVKIYGRVLGLNIILFLILLNTIINAQTICEGQTVMPTSTFDQCDYRPWILLFEDNFNGETLDLSRWEIQEWAQGALYGNGGKTQEYNSIENAIVSNGTLKIISKRETIFKRAISWKPDHEILDDGLPNLRVYYFTSSNIWTKSQFEYGKFEARVKLPKARDFGQLFGSLVEILGVKLTFWSFGLNQIKQIFQKNII